MPIHFKPYYFIQAMIKCMDCLQETHVMAYAGCLKFDLCVMSLDIYPRLMCLPILCVC